MAGKLDWKGDEERTRVINGLTQGLIDLHLRVETEAKRELYPGHGKVTATLQRSIHAAGPQYDYGNDDVKPSANSPNRSGSGGKPEVIGGVVLRFLVGSGMRYARRIESLYGYMRRGYDRVSPRAKEIITKHTKGK